LLFEPRVDRGGSFAKRDEQATDELEVPAVEGVDDLVERDVTLTVPE